MNNYVTHLHSKGALSTLQTELRAIGDIPLFSSDAFGFSRAVR